MLVPVLSWDEYQVCSPCQAVSVCKTRAIVQIDSDEAPYIELSRCSACCCMHPGMLLWCNKIEEFC